MNELHHPELHINEEPRNDFLDVAVGFATMFIGMLVLIAIASVVEYWIR